MSNFTNTFILRPLLLVAVIAGLTACNSGGSSGVATSGISSQSSASTSSSQTSSSSTNIQPPPPTKTGSFSLKWTAPATRADGSPISLSQIDGYRIYYGDKKGKYPNKVKLNNSTATSATVTKVATGTYYVVMTTVDSAGRESAQSAAITKQAM